MPASELESLLHACRRVRHGHARALLFAAFADRLQGSDPAARLEALRALPRSGLSTRVALSLCEMACDRWDDRARRAAGRAIGRLPGLPAARLQLLFTLLDASEDPRTRGRIRRAILAAGDRLAGGGGARRHAELSRRFEARDRPGLALLHQRLACELQPDAAAGQARLALLLAKAGDGRECRRRARSAVALGPRDARARFLVARTRRALGNRSEAIAACRQVLALAPRHHDCLRMLGELLCEVPGAWQEAERCLTDALAIRPDDPEVLYWRGLVRSRRGRHDDAARDLEAALQERPGWRECEEALQSARKRGADGVAAQARVMATPEDESDDTFETPDVGFDDVIGHGAAKEAIRRLLILPALHPEQAERYGVPRSGGLLLYGPPGTGKTLLARAAAAAAGARLLPVRLPDVLSKYIGETEKSIAGVFEAARAHQPCVLFFDELEALGGQREEIEHRWERSFSATFLVELSRLCLDPRSQVLVIGCSNMPWALDRALLRRGRFGVHVPVDGPGAAEREALFRAFLRCPVRDLDFAELAGLTADASGALIRGVCEDVAARAFEIAIAKGEEAPVTMDDLRAAIGRTAPDLSRWREEARRYEWFAAGRDGPAAIGFAA